jgi:hypothetical protein
VGDLHLLFFASFLAHSVMGQKRRIKGANGMSGQRRIATDMMRHRNNGPDHNRKSRPLSEARELE